MLIKNLIGTFVFNVQGGIFYIPKPGPKNLMRVFLRLAKIPTVSRDVSNTDKKLTLMEFDNAHTQEIT